jgi:hypothetical protein
MHGESAKEGEINRIDIEVNTSKTNSATRFEYELFTRLLPF